MAATSTLSAPLSRPPSNSPKQTCCHSHLAPAYQHHTQTAPRQQAPWPLVPTYLEHPRDRLSFQANLPGRPFPPDSISNFGPAPPFTSTPLSPVASADDSASSSRCATPCQNLNYPLPLSPTQSLAAIAVMQERQESWGRAAQSSSSASAASSPSSSASPTSRMARASGFELTSQTKLSHPTDGRGGKTGKPRKKVAKACLACQRSHLTCDEKRPCMRCTKKGIADQCVEGVRKKAKYLLEGDERGANDPPASSHAGPSVHTVPPMIHQTSQPMHTLPQQQLQPLPQQNSAMSQLPDLLPNQPDKPRVPEDVWLSGPLGGIDDTPIGLDARQMWGEDLGNDANPAIKQEGRGGDTMFTLGPTAAADEFHMFDAMFGNMSPVFPFDTTPGSNNNDPFGLNSMNTDAGNTSIKDNFSMNWTNDVGTHRSGAGQSVPSLTSQGNNDNALDANAVWNAWTDNNLPSGDASLQSAQGNANNASNNDISPLSHMSFSNNAPLSQPMPARSNSAPIGSASSPLGLNAQHRQSHPELQVPQQENVQLNPPTSLSVPKAQNGMAKAMSGNGQDVQPIGAGPFAMTPAGAGGQGAAFRNNRATPSEVYRSVVKPYDYTEGYHILMQYLTTNFEQRDVLRVVHSLAAYRPSLIALQMPMSEEDEVFLERSFQRTLIELEKLISYSATPTAVWRRTGEVCYANPEFCRLVGRNESDLCAKKSYIYHIFDRGSVIAYWENFSNHAFENTTQNFFQPTMLRVGTEPATPDPVKCSACYTIRRDVFDLPSVIIGQFLPIPNDLL